jgi:hypothetical protein
MLKLLPLLIGPIGHTDDRDFLGGDKESAPRQTH